MDSVQRRQMRFPVDLATLDAEGVDAEDLDAEDPGSQDTGTEDLDATESQKSDAGDADQDGVVSQKASSDRAVPPGSDSTSQARIRKWRPWTPRERRQLQRMKQRGWDDDRIGAALGRSGGAVDQQWRKQK